MLIKTTRDMHFIDRIIPTGTIGQVITKQSIYKLPMSDKGRMRALKGIYQKHKRTGLFATICGKWRWLDEGSYERG